MEMNVEAVRDAYRPQRVEILIVGESPPQSGKFFYVSSGMTTYTQKAFEAGLDRAFDSTKSFLEYFKSAGFYLDDICHKPIDKLPPVEREEALRNALVGFSNRLADMRPSKVIVVLKKLEPLVREAIALSGLHAPLLVLPFPGQGHQTKYVTQLAKIIAQN